MPITLIQSYYSNTLDLIMEYSNRLTGKEIKSQRPSCKQFQASLPTWETASKVRETHSPGSSSSQPSCAGLSRRCRCLPQCRSPGDAEIRNWSARLKLFLSLRNQCQDVKNLPHQMQRWHLDTLAYQRVGRTMTALGCWHPGFIYFPNS